MSTKKQNPQEEENAVYHSILGDEIPVNAEDEETDTVTDTNDGASESSEEKKSHGRTMKIAGISVACVAVAACLVYAGMTIYNRQKLSGPVATITTADNSTSQGLPEDQRIDLNVDKKVLACYYHDTINIFISYYGEDALKSSMGLDVSLSLKDQPSVYESGKTWFDTILSQAISTMEQQLIVCAAAQDAGFTLTETDYQLIEDAIASSDLSAYGNGVTEDDLRKTLTIQRLSTCYYQHLLDTMDITDEELEAYFEANKASYLSCTIGGMALSWAEDENGNAPMTKEVATDLKEQLEACENTEEFEQLVKTILVDYQGYSVEEVEEALPTMYNEGYTYTKNNPLSEWAFGGAKANETFSIENEDYYSVYILKEEPARDETPTVDVRHILFLTETTPVETAQAMAEEALAEWENGEKTEDSFAALANSLSEDPGSNTNGGLYESVAPGEMVTEFNDWCFDPARQPGDTGIVQTSYGFHVMYFSAAGKSAWELDAFNTIQNSRYSEWLTAQKEIYTVTVNQEIANSIDG